MHTKSSAYISDTISLIADRASTPGRLHEAAPFIKTLREEPWCTFWYTEAEAEYLDRVSKIWSLVNRSRGY